MVSTKEPFVYNSGKEIIQNGVISGSVLCSFFLPNILVVTGCSSNDLLCLTNNIFAGDTWGVFHLIVILLCLEIIVLRPGLRQFPGNWPVTQHLVLRPPVVQLGRLQTVSTNKQFTL